MAKTVKKRINNNIKRTFLLLFSIFILGTSMGIFLLYGPYNKFRNFLITTAMSTMSHQYLATWFYSDEMIQEVMANNYIVEINENSDENLVNFEEKKEYSSEYERDILEHDPNDIYKVIKVKGPGYNGFVVAVYDASKVKLASTKYLGTKGQTTKQIADQNNALVAINASGFYDPDWNSNGGIPHGTVIQNSKVIWDYVDAQVGGGIVGFTKDNVLVLGKWSANQAISKGIRDCVEFGPFLIVNGKSSFIKGDGGWGVAPRTAIGQREDGIVLLVVINGRDYLNGIKGIDMVGLTELMANYGAVNAACMDGGTSSSMIVKGELINNPININGKQGILRQLPNAWIVTE